MGFLTDAIGLTSGNTGSNYQVQNPNINEQDFSQQNAQQYQQLQNAQAQQQGLANMLMGQAQGQGPNPAQMQYQQNLDSANANTAGAIASQKGISPALAARLIAQQGAGYRQQSAAQAAQQQSQQQLNAQNTLAGVTGQQAQTALGGNQIFQGANAQQNSTITQGSLGAQQMGLGQAQNNAGLLNSLQLGLMSGIASAGGKAASGGAHWSGGEIDMQAGGHVPGKAKVDGDSPENDTVQAVLSPGERVLPRSIAHDPEKAAKFVEHLNKQKGDKPSKSYGGVLQAKRQLQQKKKDIEALLAAHKKGK